MTYLALSSSFCPNLYSSFCPQKSLLQTAHKPSNAIIFHLPVSTQVLMLALLEFLPVASRLTVSVVRSVATKSKCLDHATTNDLASFKNAIDSCWQYFFHRLRSSLSLSLSLEESLVSLVCFMISLEKHPKDLASFTAGMSAFVNQFVDSSS